MTADQGLDESHQDCSSNTAVTCAAATTTAITTTMTTVDV